MPKLIIILLIGCGVPAFLYSQTKSIRNSGPKRFVSNKPGIFFKDFVWSDTIPNGKDASVFKIRGVCKSFSHSYLVIPMTEEVENSGVINIRPSLQQEPILKISGNILYDINYRSRIDTPYAENHVYQHTVQTRIDAVYKGQYHFKVYVTSRFGNSSLFRKYTDFNLQLNPMDFKNMLKTKAIKAIEDYVNSNTRQLDSLKKLIEQKKLAIASLARNLSKKDILQKIVEERERNISWNNLNSGYQGNGTVVNEYDEVPLNNMNELKFNRQLIITSIFEKANNKKEEVIIATDHETYKHDIEIKEKQLDSLWKDLGKAEDIYAKSLSIKEGNISELSKELAGSVNIKNLAKHLNKLGVSDTILPKGYKTLLSIQNLSIGRSIADYSELSVKNISISGIQVEFNPCYYYAFAAGKVDYSFHDFIVPNYQRPRQYVALARIGKGYRNGNHVIFTYYTGKRQFFNSFIALQPIGGIPEYKLAGFTLEGLYRIGRNISIIGEIAKSTLPYYSRDSLMSKESMNKLTNFKERSNEAYALKLITYFPNSNTRIYGDLRYTGANFQSFSTFTTGASQLKWSTRIEQPFFSRQLTILSSIQQNDYSNPFVTTTYKSSSLLASLRANLRIKKWPVFSIGYFPSYQLVKTGRDQFSESRYFTFSGSLAYYYRVKSAGLISSLVYSQFYNHASDSGFVYYNSKNIFFSQNLQFNRSSLMMNATVSLNNGYNMYTIDNSGQVEINKRISVGAGIKTTNHSLLSVFYWGYNANLTLRLTRLGEIQLMMDKGFIPGLNKQLVENNMGRLTYYKIF